jgi:hypothetical protein
MIKHIVELTIPDATAESFYNFMINPSDEQYNLWWSEEHIQFHIVKYGDEAHRGDLVYFDEKVGDKHRLSFHAIVAETSRPNVIVWQMIWGGIKLPALVKLRLNDTSDGLELSHELRLGFNGIGKPLDFFIGLYFNKSFRKALETHCNIEWFKLRDMLI